MSGDSSEKPGPVIKPILTKQEEHRLKFYDEMFWSDGNLKKRQAESKRDTDQMIANNLKLLRQRDGMRPGEEKE